MNTSNVGVEIEFTGLDRYSFVCALSRLWGSYVVPVEDSKRDAYTLKDTSGQSWTILRDRSITPEKMEGSEIVSLDKDLYENYMIELVTPVLNEYSIPRLYAVLNLASEMGGIVNETCGMHIHIDLPELQEIKNILKYFFVGQEEIFKIFDVKGWRAEKYCKRLSPVFVESFQEVSSIESLQDMAYSLLAPQEHISSIKNSLRYYAVNLDAIDKHKTIEFRLFNSSLSPLIVGGNIDWLKNFLLQSQI